MAVPTEQGWRQVLFAAPAGEPVPGQQFWAEVELPVPCWRRSWTLSSLSAEMQAVPGLRARMQVRGQPVWVLAPGLPAQVAQQMQVAVQSQAAARLLLLQSEQQPARLRRLVPGPCALRVQGFR